MEEVEEITDPEELRRIFQVNSRVIAETAAVVPRVY